MFGFRPDGRRVHQEDAILAFAPYLMPQRNDAMVASVQRVDCDILTRYIRDQRNAGQIISYMDLVIAAYVRAVSQHPDLNRYICNKQLYARNDICVSMAMLKTFEDSDKILETTVKLHFSPYDTLYDVRDQIHMAVADNRKPEVANITDRFARFVLGIPGLPMVIANVARLLDRYGLLPRVIVDLSPFHTGLFFVNMASLGMPYVNHHVYNFGNTSIFLSMGKTERTFVPDKNGGVRINRILPMGVVNDERVTSGAEFGRAFGYWRDLLANPSQLETPPESIKEDFPPERIPGYRRKQRLQRRREKAIEKGA